MHQFFSPNYILPPPSSLHEKGVHRSRKFLFLFCVSSDFLLFRCMQKQDADNERQDSPVDGDEVIELIYK